MGGRIVIWSDDWLAFTVPRNDRRWVALRLAVQGHWLVLGHKLILGMFYYPWILYIDCCIPADCANLCFWIRRITVVYAGIRLVFTGMQELEKE